MGGRRLLQPPFPALGLAAWYMADRGVQFSNGAVAGLLDQSGNGIHLSQATPSKMPTYNAVDAGYNGLPTISIASASTQVLTSGTISLASPATYLFVCEVTNTNGSLLDSSSSTYHNIYFGSAGIIRTFSSPGQGFDDTGGVSFATKNCGAVIFNGTNSAIYGGKSTPHSTGTCGGGIASSWAIGGGAGPSGDPTMNGKFAELIAWNRPLSNAELSMAMVYLSAKWNGSWQ